ncbi:MAG TPA: bifunctional [glutamate--ammonia ligase]-adenylyl-L-tyrosine phosphorylase/[glutamate--ammonia-ligase] adenylyltransferase [Methylophilaceae bacterium]|nr:bifunctional [glutamate--ammonia ligase]-adenylyl-L-tyrosine phosphorylase/[glutamate--ammonia-ligase] adenylyltransferase [Methylophilaceae bacterium]
MLTWDMILTENRATSREAGYLIHAASCSPFLTRLLSKDALLLNDLLENLHQAYLIKDMQTWFLRKKSDDEIALKQRLRQLRQHVLARTIVRDINGLADFEEVVTITSALAELTIQQAIAFHQAQLITQHGTPRSLTQAPQSLIVVGMGKLGGSELNVSSDIDLIFSYEQDGQTDGAESISNQMFFTKLAKKVIAALDEVTEDGFVFRVDMRLRPFGSEGALVSSLDALEDYYQNYGREWERYAWIKGRVVAGPSTAINKLLRPFIFRKYLDFNAYSAMRDLKLQIQRDVVQRGLEDNIKLGRGGIREIEFIVQLFQLIRGGQDADLQIKPTLQTLKVLGDKGLISQTAVAELTQCYIFLRHLEHRLMYVDDQQTQDLPKSLETKQRILKMMQMHDWDTFINQLNQYRAIVQSHFDATFSDTQRESHVEAHAIWQGVTPADEACEYLYQSGYQDAMETLRRLNTLHASSRYQQLPQQSKTRLDRLMPLVIHQAAQTPQPDDALVRTINLLESICRRASYLALLAEFPDALALVVKLCAASPWLAQYLSAHPILLDELLNTQNLYAVPDFSVLKSELEKKMQQLEGDVEAQMDAMRHFKHSTVLRFAAQDVAAQLPLERLSDYLSGLAQVILQVSLQTVWQSLRFKHQETPQFAIIGYGKLGGKELGYMSDLDIIFLYNDAHPDAAEIYAKFAQRINNWFNSLTNAGLLYETDLQLRPDGNSGLLVSSVEAFTDYQLNKAWVWEHQAITRARFVAGDNHVGASFESVRHKVLMKTRDEDGLKAEVVDMRQKMRATHKPQAEWFDVKHDAGGIIDVEFIVQYLVLRYANTHAQLIENIGNIALLHTLAALGLIEQAIAEKVANAYRAYRIIIHSTRLQEKEAKVQISEIEAHRTAVLLLWQQVLLD